MNRRAAHWNKREKLIFLIIVALVFVAANTAILVSVFTEGALIPLWFLHPCPT